MTHHLAPLDQWHWALSKALEDGAVEAIPGILVRMARDGWGKEAENARQVMALGAAVASPPSLGSILGHDEEAARQLEIIRDAYRRGGLEVLRAVTADTARLASEDAVALLLVEAVLTLEERGPGARRAAEQARFDRAEQANDDEAIRRGGGGL